MEIGEGEIKVGILVISDKAFRGERKDLCGPFLKEELKRKLKAEILTCEIIPNDEDLIIDRLKHLVDRLGCNLVITSGGTGLGLKDVTPEATRKVIEREVPGISEAMRILNYSKTPFSLISRAVCGTRARSLIINLPGSPKAVEESLGIILKVIPHTLAILCGDTDTHPTA